MSTPGATPDPAPGRRTLHPASYIAPAAPGHPYRWLTEVPRPGSGRAVGCWRWAKWCRPSMWPKGWGWRKTGWRCCGDRC